MTIMAHASNATECDKCERPIGASRALAGLHLVCASCAGGASAPPAASEHAPSRGEAVWDEIDRMTGRSPAAATPPAAVPAAARPPTPAPAATGRESRLAGIADAIEQGQASGEMNSNAPTVRVGIYGGEK